MYRKGSLLKHVAWQRVPVASLLVAAASLPALASLSSAQTAGGAPAASAKTVPIAAPKSTTVWLNASAMPPSPTIVRTPADPPPFTEKSQWIYDLRYSAGDLYLLGIHPFELAAPQATPRAMGRFAFELYEGPVLIERVRFDFPMLGDGALAPVGFGPRGAASPAAPDAGIDRTIHGPAPSFAGKLVTRIGVMFPASKRGTKLIIVDRASDTRWPLPWPPVEMSSAVPGGEASAADAGSGEGG